LPVKATAQTSPSRLTTVIHMSRLKPPLSSPRALASASFAADQAGTDLQSAANAEADIIAVRANAVSSFFIMVSDSPVEGCW
jgi:hypothetical protein